MKKYLWLSVWLWCSAFLYGQEGVFEGVVLERLPDERAYLIEGMIGAEDKLSPTKVSVSSGDYEIDYTGRVVRGNLREENGTLRLEQIFPHDSETLIQMEQYNRQLRRDTVTRGRKAFRGEGEYLPQFALFNQFGEMVTPQDLLGKYVVMNFIFTRCSVPTMCPAGTKRMSDLQELLAEKNLSDNIQLVTITFDPDFDSPGILKAYAEAYGIEHKNFFFLTGDRQAIADLTRQFGITTKEEDGTIDHSMATTLVDKKGRITYWRPGSRWTIKDFASRIERMEE